MLTKQDKSVLRSSIFRHLDGIATAPTVYTLYKHGVLETIIKEDTISLPSLTSKFNANEGYLNVALRILCSQGWLTQNIDNGKNTITYSVNANSKKAFALAHLYEDVVNFLNYAARFPEERMGADVFIILEKLFLKFENKFGLKHTNTDAIEAQVLKHIEGAIAGPIVVLLGMNGFFHKYFMEASFRAQEYHKDPESFKKILDFFSHINWFKKKNDTYKFTDEGLFFAKRASAYGVTVSYLPTFVKLDELLFGNPTILRNTNPEDTEKHVHREMNVWGSGGAHSTYFKVIDNIVIELFNRPIEEQPKGILDMGCGNGAFIEHMFNVIEQRTIRGKILEEHPLFLVGADFNKAALKVTRANLIKADIWAKVIWGDIGRPDLLAQDLKDDYSIDLIDLLNVRTFLDHNRIWEAPKNDHNILSTSSGAYASQGTRLNNNHVEASLKEHLTKWKPFVEKFGLLLIELHTIAPELTAENLGKTAATAYDATHGYSDQYIVEVDVFRKVAELAGLYSDTNHMAKFPDSDLATVSINLLKG